MLQHIGAHDHIKLLTGQAGVPSRVFQVGLQRAFAKGRAHGQSFGVHFYARNLTAPAVQNARDGARASAQLEHALARLNHSSQARGGTASVGVNFVGVAMFYH